VSFNLSQLGRIRRWQWPLAFVRIKATLSAFQRVTGWQQRLRNARVEVLRPGFGLVADDSPGITKQPKTEQTYGSQNSRHCVCHVPGNRVIQRMQQE
jgi:hypothetical protein